MHLIVFQKSSPADKKKTKLLSYNIRPWMFGLNLPKWLYEKTIVFWYWLSNDVRRFDDVHERNQRAESERYLAKRRSNGDKRDVFVEVEINVGKRFDSSSVDKRVFQLMSFLSIHIDKSTYHSALSLIMHWIHHLSLTLCTYYICNRRSITQLFFSRTHMPVISSLSCVVFISIDLLEKH